MNSFTRFAARAGTALVLLAGISGTALAQNTPSNTTINNSATLNYKVNNVTQSPICSSPAGNNTSTCTNTTFQVDTKVNLTIVTTDTAGVATTPGGSGVMSFTVTNNGNSIQDVILGTNTAVANGQTVFAPGSTATDSFNPTSCTIFAADGVTVITRVASLGIGLSSTVKVSCTIPTLKSTGPDVPFVPADATLVGLTGQAAASGGGAALVNVARAGATPGVVLADDDGVDDNLRDGISSARSALKVAPAALTVAKVSATLCDGTNGSTVPKAIPGAYVRYTVTITNGTAAGTASAFMTALNDALDNNVAFDQDYIVGTGAAAACAPAATGGTATSAAGSGVEVSYTGTRAAFVAPKYLTTAASVTGVVGASLALAIPVATWNTLLPVDGAYAVGEVKPGDVVTVKFNVIVR